MKLENESLLVEIAELGAEVTRIYDKETDTEILWEGNPTYWKRHSPILFPNVGKTYQNTVRIDGRQYATSQHGFARDSVFDLAGANGVSASFVLRASEESKKAYPYEFELAVTYRLCKKELEVEWQVKSLGGERTYFTIGAHPAFRFAKAEETKDDYCLRFPGKEQLDYILLDAASGTGVADVVYPILLDEGTCPLSEEMFARDALVFDGGQIGEAWLCHKDKSPYVGVRCAEFENFGIWSVKDAPFVCLEPWAGRCDDKGCDGDISQKPGIHAVEGGDVFSRKYTIVVA